MKLPWSSSDLRNAFAKKSVRIHGKLGSGSFKAAFRASKAEHSFALKVVYPDNVDSRRGRERIRREIMGMGAVRSPYLVNLYEADVISIQGRQTVFWLEELIEGEDFQQKLSRGSLSCEDSVRIITAICEAISALWAKGIVHRDIKPEHIRISKEGIPKLLDLGIARHVTLVSETDSFAATGPGTPMYMAPEQIKNQKRLITERTDQFALGIVLFKMLTGVYPFAEHPNGLSRDEIFRNILTLEPRRPSSLRKGIPRGLDVIVLRMLSKHPAERYPTCEKLMYELKSYNP